MKVEFAPLNIPLERRLQTAAVFQWVFSFLLLAQCCCGIFMIFVFGDYWFISAFYALWLYLDWETPQTGGRRSKWVRNWTVWRYFKEYFPIHLIKTSDLDPSQNYLFGFHPHGVLVAGAFGNFCTEYTGFKKLFPGLTPYLHILPFWFRCPFFRDYIMCAGLVSASKKSVSHVLSHEGGGNVAVIVIGGAEESLDARPGSLTLSILKRKGFIKVALKHGAQLVPVFSFGENELFKQVANPKGSRLRTLQEKLQKIMGFALPLFHGRGIFQYSFGVMPYRKPVHTIVGNPIAVKQHLNPTVEEINQLHEKYLQELQELFDKNKEKNRAGEPRLGISKLGRGDGLSPLARRSPAREEDPPRGRREAALAVALWAPSGVKPLRRRALKVEFAPFNIPLERRLQTAAVFQWVFSSLLLAQCCCGIFMIFVFGDYWFISAFYALWLYLDWETPQTGGRRSEWFRNWTVWRYFKEYFPIHLIKTSDLDPSQNYLFGFHPHGVLVAGAFGNFCTEYTGFKKLFPGLTPYLHVFPLWLRCPFFRDYIMCAGLVSASKKSVSHVLSHEGGGNVAVIVIGGAEESLDARPGSLTLSILKRKGFIKVALKHGAQLVPVFSFGENELFKQVANPKGSRLRTLQEKMQKIMGFTLPLFHGRGIFQYSFGVMPYRKPIHTIVGNPIAVKQNLNPTVEEINQLHEKYLQELQELFDKNKEKYGISEHASLTFT